MTNIFGSDWAIEYLLPPLGEIMRHQSYLRRLSAVQALVLMAAVMDPPEYATTEILPLVLLMATDSVSFYCLDVVLIRTIIE